MLILCLLLIFYPASHFSRTFSLSTIPHKKTSSQTFSYGVLLLYYYISNCYYFFNTAYCIFYRYYYCSLLRSSLYMLSLSCSFSRNIIIYIGIYTRLPSTSMFLSENIYASLILYSSLHSTLLSAECFL